MGLDQRWNFDNCWMNHSGEGRQAASLLLLGLRRASTQLEERVRRQNVERQDSTCYGTDCLQQAKKSSDGKPVNTDGLLASAVWVGTFIQMSFDLSFVTCCCQPLTHAASTGLMLRNAEMKTGTALFPLFIISLNPYFSNNWIIMLMLLQCMKD